MHTSCTCCRCKALVQIPEDSQELSPRCEKRLQVARENVAAKSVEVFAGLQTLLSQVGHRSRRCLSCLAWCRGDPSPARTAKPRLSFQSPPAAADGRGHFKAQGQAGTSVSLLALGSQAACEPRRGRGAEPQPRRRARSKPAACRWRRSPAGAQPGGKRQRPWAQRAPPGQARGTSVPAEHCWRQVRAVQSHCCLWSVPADVPSSSVPMAERGAGRCYRARSAAGRAASSAWTSATAEWHSAMDKCGRL